jgi:hypothetical protein
MAAPVGECLSAEPSRGICRVECGGKFILIPSDPSAAARAYTADEGPDQANFVTLGLIWHWENLRETQVAANKSLDEEIVGRRMPNGKELAVTLKIAAAGQARTTLEQLVKKICSAATVGADGTVTVPGGPYANKQDALTCCCLFGLASSRKTVTIRPMRAADINKFGPGVAVPTSDEAQVKKAGTPPKVVRNGNGADVNVYIDVNDNNGRGYFGYTADLDATPIKFTKIDSPLDVVLYHELCTGHAMRMINGQSDPDDKETAAIVSENAYRALQTPPRSPRVIHAGGKNTSGTRPQR